VEKWGGGEEKKKKKKKRGIKRKCEQARTQSLLHSYSFYS
jgi:hypothetical protein